jgi:hypothetical protein
LKRVSNQCGQKTYCSTCNSVNQRNQSFNHGFLPPSADLVCCNPIMPQEGTFYNLPNAGAAP